MIDPFFANPPPTENFVHWIIPYFLTLKTSSVDAEIHKLWITCLTQEHNCVFYDPCVPHDGKRRRRPAAVRRELSEGYSPLEDRLLHVKMLQPHPSVAISLTGDAWIEVRAAFNRTIWFICHPSQTLIYTSKAYS